LARWNNSLQTRAEIQRLKRDAVIHEAGKAFSERGYHDTSLDDIAKALGVSKGTLYNYVKDKQEILFELHRLAGDIGSHAFAAARAEGGTGAQMLRSSLVRFIYGLTEQLGACRVLMEFDALKPEDRIQAKKIRDAFESSFVEFIQAGISDGSLRKIEPRLMVFTFMGAVNWIPRWFSPKGRLTGQYIAESMTDMLLNGLVAKGAKGTISTPPRMPRATLADKAPSAPKRQAAGKRKTKVS